jgi:hypothetical protein
VKFSNALYPSTVTEVISLTLYHPCKITVITGSPISAITYNYGDPTLVVSFPRFPDTVSTQYGVANMCNLVYTLSDAVNASSSNFNITVTPGTTPSLNILTSNIALKGMNSDFTLTAVSTPLQDTPLSTPITFNLLVYDSCMIDVVSISYTLAAMVSTVT